jgi:hypothetical protein
MYILDLGLDTQIADLPQLGISAREPVKVG